MKPSHRLLMGLAAAALLLPATASATSYGSPASHSEIPEVCSTQRPDLCLDGVGGAVTSLDSIRVVTYGRTTAGAGNEQTILQQARGSVSSAHGAAAASESMAGWSIWAGGGWNDYDSSVSIAPYDATAITAVMGADRFFTDRFLAGFTLGFESLNTDTTYNGGGQDRKGLQGGLYGAYLIDDTFSVDAAVVYGSFDTDESRVDPGTSIRVGTVATPGATLLSSYDADRWFATVNLNAFRTYDKWVVGARLGVLYTREDQDAYMETGGAGARTIGKRRVDLTQGYASMDVGYSIGAFEPYGLLGYRYDFSSDDGSSAGGLPAGVNTQPDDDDDWQFGFGVRYFGSGGVTGSAEWVRTEGRTDFNDDLLTLTLRIPF